MPPTPDRPVDNIHLHACPSAELHMASEAVMVHRKQAVSPGGYPLVPLKLSVTV